MVEHTFRQALMLHRQARHQEARRLYLEVIRVEPRHVEALTFLGVLALESQEAHRALLYLERAVDVDPGNVAGHLMRGHAQARLGLRGAALSSYERAAALRPDLADVHFHRGSLLLESGAREAAVASFDRMIAIDPAAADAHLLRGNALRELRRREAALASYDRAIAIRPDFAQAHSNRGNLLAEFGRFDESLASFEAALAFEPRFAEALCNRGKVLLELERHEEALRSFDRALEADPDHAPAYCGRAIVRLLLGDLENGWRDFEWRWQNPHWETRHEKRNFQQPLWLGGTDLRGRKILVHGEQGLGDMIQFCRYVRDVADLGANVILEVPRPLASLFESLEGVAQLVTRGSTLPEFDLYCPLMSLPLAFGTRVSSIPARIPYLRPKSDRELHWRRRLGGWRAPRVGLVWSGGCGAGYSERWAVNERRNIPLSELEALSGAAIEFHSLQKGQPAESELVQATERGWAGPVIMDHAADLTDFGETAALIAQLDLVISVDTATAHLAGAMGKPVWILNRRDTCWRWLLERTDSPWYPTARLYRQERAGNWSGVMRRVRADLERFAAAPEELV